MNNKLVKGLSFGGVLCALTLALAGVASAQSAFDPQEGVTTLATDAATDLGPMMLAVAGVFIVLLVVGLGIRFVWGMARRNR